MPVGLLRGWFGTARRWWSSQVCKCFGHTMDYKGYALCKATYEGKAWPFKCYQRVYQCRYCGYSTKSETMKIEDVQKERRQILKDKLMRKYEERRHERREKAR